MLNRAWQIAVFTQALTATQEGTFIYVGPQHAEVTDLVERGFIKLDKRKKDAEGNVSATVPEGITLEQVTTTLNSADVAAPAPAPQPVAVEAAPAPAPAPVETATPGFDGQAVAQPATTVADVVLGGADHAVLDTVELGGAQFEIETGVQFVKRTPNIGALARNTVREDKYPFAAIADLKARPENIDNDEFLPSFHVAGKQLKNMSNMLKRYIDKYEAAGQVTFRAQQVKDGEDVKGYGVRIFAMNKATAPERKSPIRKKKEAEQVTDMSATPTATPVNGYEGVQQG